MVQVVTPHPIPYTWCAVAGTLCSIQPVPDVLVVKYWFPETSGSTTPHSPALVQEIRSLRPLPGVVNTRVKLEPTRFQTTRSTLLEVVVTLPTAKQSAALGHDTAVVYAVSPTPGTGNLWSTQV
jgi:hypothetical protein